MISNLPSLRLQLIHIRLPNLQIQNLNMLFKKYEHVQVDTDNNIYAITKDTKDFITNNYDSYTTAYDLLHF